MVKKKSNTQYAFNHPDHISCFRPGFMIDIDKYLRLQERKIGEFSGRFMNNTK
jgi:hypothetical protein